jgi:hypothetical protein
VAGPGNQWMFLRVCLCTFFAAFCPLNHAQQPTSGAAQPAQAEPGADASESPGKSDQKLSGLAVVVKVASIAGDPLFHADGYSIRVQSGTVTAFSGSLKSLADVVPGTWIHFEGVRGDTGVLVAHKAEFFPPGSRKSLTAMGPRKAKHAPDYQPVTRDSLLDADGHIVSPHTKVRLSDAGGPCGWHRVPADPPLQERVERIGMQIVPAFQKQLPADSPSRIPFRSIEQILPPAVVAAAQHAHDLAAGVQREGARLAQQNHVVDLAEHAVALAAVAGVAAGHQVLPGGVAAARAGNHVVQRQVAGGSASPQYWQVLRSRSRMFLRERARVW